MVLRQDTDTDFPRQRRSDARKAVAEAAGTFDPADTHHYRSSECQINSLLLKVKQAQNTLTTFYFLSSNAAGPRFVEPSLGGGLSNSVDVYRHTVRKLRCFTLRKKVDCQPLLPILDDAR